MWKKSVFWFALLLGSFPATAQIIDLVPTRSDGEEGRLAASTDSFDLRSPYAPSPTPVMRIDIHKNETSHEASLDYKLSAWFPKGPGLYPVFLFMTGLNGIAPVEAYQEMFTMMASQGIFVIAVAVQNIQFYDSAGYQRLGMGLAKLARWQRLYLKLTLAASPLVPKGIVPNVDQLIVSGHSSSGKAIVELYRNAADIVSGLVFLDPVDQDGISKAGSSFGNGEILNRHTPLLVLASGLGHLLGRDIPHLWIPCAPEGYSSSVFFSHFSSPKWFIRALDYGHADMLGGIYHDALLLSQFCKTAPPQFDLSAYRRFISGAVASFIAGAVQGNQQALNYLEQPQLIPLRSSVEFYRGNE